MDQGNMFVTIVFAAIVSIQFVSVNADAEAKCLDGNHHKQTPSPETGFAACLPWEDMSCCSAETTVELKTNQTKILKRFDWYYCGELSKVN